MSRCPCVAARCARLPLRLGSLERSRAGSSALGGGGFSGLLGTLSERFAFEHVELSVIDPTALSRLDALLLCTTEGPALTDAELAAVRAWVEAGGALVANAFSNWSAYSHYARSLVGWLGLQPRVRARFERLSHYAVEPHGRARAPQPYSHSHTHTVAGAAGELCAATDAETASLCGSGPFGPATRFVNLGDTYFDVLDSAFEAGGVQLVVKV